MSRPYDPRSTPHSTTSPWPASIASRTRSWTVRAGTLVDAPRACHTMQYVHRWSHPSCTLMNARDRSAGASRRPIWPRRHGEHVSRDAVLVTVREDRVDRRVRAGVCVDAAAREHQVRIGVETPQPANPLARGGIRLRGDRAGVEHANVGGLALRNDVASTGGEPACEVRHLGEVHLAPEHGERDAQRAIDWRAHAGGGAATASRSPAAGEEQRCRHRPREPARQACATRGGR